MFVVTVLYTNPVSSFFASTCALATTAPDESVTWPLIDDVLTCATTQAASNKMAMNVPLIFLMS